MAASEEMKTLIKRRDDIENEIKELTDVLESVSFHLTVCGRVKTAVGQVKILKVQACQPRLVTYYSSTRSI
jgi:hypothetical protein